MRRLSRHSVLLALLCLGFVALVWAAPVAAGESTLDQVLKRGKLLVGIGLGAPPFGMYDADKKPTGFDVDLAKLIAQELKVEIEWVDTTSVNRIPYLLTNKVDLVIATFGNTPERAKQVSFTKPYCSWNLVLLGWKKDRDIKSHKDLKGKTVGVTRGTTQDIAITRLAPDAKIVRYEDDPVAMLAFEQKKADVMPTAEVIALKKVKDNKEMEIKGLVTRSWSAIGVRRGDPDWLQWLNTFMDWHGGQGKFSEMFEKWTGVEMPPALPSY
jgi:polar amino acid transport system substrate-binding protein